MMEFQFLAWPAVVLLAITTCLLLASRDWRWGAVMLAVQYLGLLALVAQSWPLELAVIKLVAGWMSAAVLGIAMLSAPEVWRNDASRAAQTAPVGPVFRMLAALVVGLMVFSVTPGLETWLPAASLSQLYGGALLVGMGLLHLGLTAQPLRVALGLLTVLSGFELWYATMEDAALVAGLLAVVNLSLALVGAYLLLAPGMEAGE
jgi:hypothetical protein